MLTGVPGSCVRGGAKRRSKPSRQRRTPKNDRRGHRRFVPKRAGAGSLSRGDPGSWEKASRIRRWKGEAQVCARFQAQAMRCTTVTGRTSGGLLSSFAEKRRLAVKRLRRHETKRAFRTRWGRRVGSVPTAASERERQPSPDTLVLNLRPCLSEYILSGFKRH